MKTIKLLFTVLAVAIVAIATAVEKPKMNVVPLSSDRAVISIENEKATYFDLSIHASNGDLVYFKQSAKPLTSYQKVFDFANLENGNYSMNLKVNDIRLSRTLTVSSKRIEIGESKLRFDPHFNFTDDVLKFSYLNFDEENYRLKIYNQDELIYESELGRNFSITSGYNLSKLKAGKYNVILSSLNNEFNYSLEK